MHARLLPWLLLLATCARAQDMHFKPRDHALGDVHPFFHEGECFLYSLKPGKYDSVLARSRDWLGWTETPLTHDAVTEGDWISPYFVLGVWHDAEAGLFRSFYGHKEGRMVSSVSRDLLHWSCAPKEFHIPPADYYQRRRDPFVFWIPEMKQYGCVMTTWMKGRPKESCGAVSLATSPDLQRWKDHGPILDPGTIGEPECPQMFQLGGRWYLLASVYNRAVGGPVYWSSTSPLGPWKAEPDGMLDGKDVCAAQVSFEDGTPFLFGWIPLKPSRPGKQTWGGHLALPREVHALSDGRLGTRLAAKVAAACERLPWQKEAGKWERFVVEFMLTMPQDDKDVRASLAPLGEVVFQKDRLRILDAAGECWSELVADLRPDKPMKVRLFVDGDMVEVFVDGRYSLAARLPAQTEPVGLAVLPDVMAEVRVAEWRLGR